MRICVCDIVPVFHSTQIKFTLVQVPLQSHTELET
jgi:hypothetical protein